MKKINDLFRYKIMEWHMQANEERRAWGQRTISLAEYVRRYRWWLRDKFRKDQNVGRDQ
jgi:hypothetical protein